MAQKWMTHPPPLSALAHPLTPNTFWPVPCAPVLLPATQALAYSLTRSNCQWNREHHKFEIFIQGDIRNGTGSIFIFINVHLCCVQKIFHQRRSYAICSLFKMSKYNSRNVFSKLKARSSWVTLKAMIQAISNGERIRRVTRPSCHNQAIDHNINHVTRLDCWHFIKILILSQRNKFILVSR